MGVLKMKARREAADHARALRGIATEELAAFDRVSRLSALLDGARSLERGAASKGALAANVSLLSALAEQRAAAERHLSALAAQRVPVVSQLSAASLRQHVLKERQGQLQAALRAERDARTQEDAADTHNRSQFRTPSGGR